MKRKRHTAILKTAARIAFMQLILCITFISIGYAKTASAQDVLNKHVTVTVENTEIKKVIVQLQHLTEAKFIYSSQTIDANRKISFSVSDKTLKDLLDEFFVPLGINYKPIDDKILLYHADAPQKENAIPMQASVKSVDKIISGTVTNETGQPLAGVSVTVQGTKKGTVTDGFGHFQIDVADENAVLEISYVGYQPKTVAVAGRKYIADNLNRNRYWIK